MKDEKKNLLLKLKKNKKLIIGVGILFIVIITLILVINNKEGKVEIVTKSELISIAKKNDLNTASYIYNGIAKKTDEKNKPVYYVNYKGTVIAGIDLDKIEIEQDNKHKKIVVRVPKVYIKENKVENNNIDIIFLDNKYKTETVHVEACDIAVKDLTSKSKNNKYFLEKAQKKLDAIIQAFIQPLIDATDNEFVLVLERGK